MTVHRIADYPHLRPRPSPPRPELACPWLLGWALWLLMLHMACGGSGRWR